MSHANTVEASSKAGGHKPSYNHKAQRNIRNRSSRPVQTSVTETVIDLPDVEQLRRARTEYFGESRTMRRRNSSREMADIVDSRLRQAGPREASRRSSIRAEHESPGRQHGRHRHRRKVEDDEEERKIVYVYKQAGDGRRPQANAGSQARLSTTTTTTTRRSRSRRSNHQRPETRGLFSRRTTSLVDVVSRPLVDIVEGGRETSSSYEKLMKRPTTRKRHSERSLHPTDQPRVTR